ncbi:HupE/UreJ family protein [Pseudorhodoferax sp. Leaf267]|uniref:HupE/UreJ family protein n=1 Tax=Pseudorhodoferax sp. Leaf267 TaxID=1736316 RepID=UPI0006FD4136|nr:HupE/UreJ family protein [Pseudorhodoferax sp. Leaf267]KQP18306.1 hypothetical protein ASF43_10840 [Pseudorhodoferax sp. Leaf267]
MRRALLWLLLALAPAAWAHKGSDAYLDVRSEAGAPLQMSLAVAIKDLDLVVPLDADADGRVTWGEIKSAAPAVRDVLGASTALDGAAVCPLAWTFAGLERRSDGVYLRWTASPDCPGAQALRYALLREQDATHRLIVTGHIDGQDLLTTWSPQQPGGLVLRASTAPSAAAAPHSGPATLWTYLQLGMHHLLEGYDHLAFLLALVLPLRLALGRAQPALRPAVGPAHHPSTWWALLRTVTAFTVGHSITLVLATLGFTQASPAWVEPVIALSIGVTALLNLYPAARVRPDVLALLFGLVHGFGFAGLLTEAAAPSGLLPWALAGFNLGVECGQLLAVAGWVLLSQLVVRRSWYGSVVVRGGSWALVLLSAWWFWERVR